MNWMSKFIDKHDNTNPISYIVLIIIVSYSIKVVQWSEDLYETQLIERTKDACGGEVDIVIDFGSTSRSLNRSLQCLQEVCV